MDDKQFQRLALEPELQDLEELLELEAAPQLEKIKQRLLKRPIVDVSQLKLIMKLETLQYLTPVEGKSEQTKIILREVVEEILSCDIRQLAVIYQVGGLEYYEQRDVIRTRIREKFQMIIRELSYEELVQLIVYLYKQIYASNYPFGFEITPAELRHELTNIARGSNNSDLKVSTTNVEKRYELERGVIEFRQVLEPQFRFLLEDAIKFFNNSEDHLMQMKELLLYLSSNGPENLTPYASLCYARYNEIVFLKLESADAAYDFLVELSKSEEIRLLEEPGKYLSRLISKYGRNDRYELLRLIVPEKGKFKEGAVDGFEELEYRVRRLLKMIMRES